VVERHAARHNPRYNPYSTFDEALAEARRGVVASYWSHVAEVLGNYFPGSEWLVGDAFDAVLTMENAFSYLHDGRAFMVDIWMNLVADKGRMKVVSSVTPPGGEETDHTIVLDVGQKSPAEVVEIIRRDVDGICGRIGGG